MSAGEQQGRFELLEVVGSGGMGAVHRALDRETGRVVAFKRLHAPSSALVERFEREAEVLSRLEHPAIVGYVAHGRADDGAPYLAMEWLAGEDLAARLARGPLPVVDALALAERVASALDAAHARGIVHRDVKPSNVFLPQGDVRSARVLDFGIARLGGALPMTGTGIAMGTPGYMAPEQARGERDIDARADVFSLGCVLYECVTGAPAFGGAHVMAQLARILFDEPVPPRELAPDVSPALEALIVRLLSKQPKDRPADGAATLEALARLGAPTVSLQPPRSAIGVREQRWVSVVIARDAVSVSTEEAPTLSPDEASVATRLGPRLADLGARLERLLDGTLVALLEVGGPAHDRAVQAARCALVVRSELAGERPVALVTGRALAAGRLPVGEVVEHGVRLLGAPTPERGVRLDAVAAGLLDARFELGGDAHGLLLMSERRVADAPRPLLGRPSPCVGRDRELGVLGGLLDECVAEGVARAVLVTAPPGVGKSRVLRELLARTSKRDDAPTVLVARADAMSAGAPYGLFAQLVRDLTSLSEGEPLDVARNKLKARFGRHLDAPTTERVSTYLGELVGVPAEREDIALRTARRDALAMGDQIVRASEELLRAETAAGAVLLVLEDVHWGDAPSLRVIDLALRRLGERPLLVLATARPEVHQVFPGLFAERDVQELRLAPLPARASERLVRAALGPAVDDAAILRIVARGEGNALFLEEMIRATAEDGGEALPGSVLAILESRIAAQDDFSRRVLRAASVFGEVFWRAGVDALVGGASSVTALARLVEREIVELRPTSRFLGQEEYAFRHALVRDAAYASLTRDDLVLGHRLAAEWLSEAGERDGVTLAEHWERAGAPHEAARSWVAAAEQALEGNDFAGAAERAARAAAAGGGPQGTARCHALVAEAEQWRGRYREAADAAARARAELEPDSVPWYRAQMLAVIAHFRLHDVEALGRIGGEALSFAPRADTAPARTALLARLAARLWFAGQCLDLVDRLLAAAPVAAAAAADDDLETQAWLGLAEAIHLHQQGNYLGYLERMERVAETLERAGNLRESIAQRDDIGWWWGNCGRHDQAERVSRGVIEAADRLGLRRIAVSATHALSVCLCSVTRFEEALALERPVLATRDLPEAEAQASRALALLALVGLGRYEEALQMRADASALLTWEWDVVHASSVAEAQLGLGDAEGALATLQGCAERTAQSARVGLLSFHLDRVEAMSHLRRGDRERARAAVQRGLTAVRALGAGFSGGRAAAARQSNFYARTLYELAEELGVASEG